MFYLVIVQNDSVQTVHVHQTLDSALSEYHSELAYRGDTRMKTMCAILNSIGELIRRECWERTPSEE